MAASQTPATFAYILYMPLSRGVSSLDLAPQSAGPLFSYEHVVSSVPFGNQINLSRANERQKGADFSRALSWHEPPSGEGRGLFSIVVNPLLIF